MNFLFICSRNKWRSPTAEKVWRDHFGFQVRSAGTGKQAKRVVSANDIQWANIIFVMEQKHKERIRARFRQLTERKEIIVLDIPDLYEYMDQELVDIFTDLGEQYQSI